MSNFIGLKTVLPSEVSTTNPNIGDLYIEQTGTIGTLTDADRLSKQRAAVQGIQNRLALFKGEYFLSLKEGMPYFQSILVKNPSIPLIKSLILQVILSYPGIISVPQLDTDWNRSTRILTVTFTANLDGGIQIVSSDFGSIILNLSLDKTATT